MYELVKINENDYYIDAPCKVGIYRVSDEEVYLIDTGNDRPFGKKIKAIFDEAGWKLRAIFITHAHADHIGSATYLSKVTGCKIYARGFEASMTRQSILESISIYGGMPAPEMMNKFLLAEKADALLLTDDALPEGLSVIELPGHSPEMVGFVTAGGTAYIADSIASAETIEKYKVTFLYNPEDYFKTLEVLRGLEAKTFVPSHAEVSNDISELIELNFQKTREIIDMVRNILTTDYMSTDDVIFEVFRRYEMEMNITQYALAGSTIRSIISYLTRKGELGIYTTDYKLRFKKY